MIRAIRNRYLARSLPGSADQSVKAARAAATARSTSSAVPRANSASTCSVAGLTVFSASLPEESTNWPPMKWP